MARVAGVDIGNSTTEIVVQAHGRPIAWQRRPTRGPKGSPGSIRAAAALLRAIESAHGIKADRVVVAPWRPVTTEVACVAEPPPDTGRIRVVDCAGHSVSGDDAVAGVPWDIRQEPPDAPSVIAVVSADTGYRDAVARVDAAAARGCPVAAVLAARDEAVLIAARLGVAVPVLDGVDTAAALRCETLFVEVRPAGHCVSTASDVWALKSLLAASDADTDALSLVSRWVRDERAAVIGLCDERRAPAYTGSRFTLTWREGGSGDLFGAIDRLAGLPVGAVREFALAEARQTLDLWGVDISSAMQARGVRSAGHSRDVVLASLADAEASDAIDLDEVFGVPVTVACSEAAAASHGARTTPGLNRAALILDIGGGTIDLVGESGVTAAGAGEMLTAAVSRVLDVPRGAADWIKRGPARRVESPQVLLNEDGSRHFAAAGEPSVSPRLVGALVARGPGGFTSFGGALQPAEWRIIRQSLKLDVIAKNVARVLATYRVSHGGNEAHDVVIVGGPAGDEELLPAIARLDAVSACGRANVAGHLGHRYAVAYGLTLQG